MNRQSFESDVWLAHICIEDYYETSRVCDTSVIGSRFESKIIVQCLSERYIMGVPWTNVYA